MPIGFDGKYYEKCSIKGCPGTIREVRRKKVGKEGLPGYYVLEHECSHCPVRLTLTDHYSK